MNCKEKEERKYNNDKYRLSGNTFRCKVKLCKTFQGKESLHLSLSLIAGVSVQGNQLDKNFYQ